MFHQKHRTHTLILQVMFHYAYVRTTHITRILRVMFHQTHYTHTLITRSCFNTHTTHITNILQVMFHQTHRTHTLITRSCFNTNITRITQVLFWPKMYVVHMYVYVQEVTIAHLKCSLWKVLSHSRTESPSAKKIVTAVKWFPPHKRNYP